MAEQRASYVIVGAGLAGASAIKGIREHDQDGSILLLGSEEHLPYDRPPLSKDLWLGKKQPDAIFLNDKDFYADNQVELALGTEVVALDPQSKTVRDTRGNTYRFDKALLATGGLPRRLEVAGGDLGRVCYYRGLNDYRQMRGEAARGKSAVVIGGGFIGSEMAAALHANGLEVTMVFPGPHLCDRVFPEGLGTAITEQYRKRGIVVRAGDKAASFEERGEKLVTGVERGEAIESDLVVVGVGILPDVGLAQAAGLEVEDGIVVNEMLQTSHPDIYAAGDNALFPDPVLGERRRVEHWDNARKQGQQAGRNMAGAGEAYTYMPYFYSDLFEFGYEAVGDANARLETFSDWHKENDTGVIYYLKDGKVRGAMMCNVWKKLKAARELIRSGETMTPEDLRGAIK